jgi:hypothetical protein
MGLEFLATRAKQQASKACEENCSEVEPLSESENDETYVVSSTAYQELLKLSTYQHPTVCEPRRSVRRKEDSGTAPQTATLDICVVNLNFIGLRQTRLLVMQILLQVVLRRGLVMSRTGRKLRRLHRACTMG